MTRTPILAAGILIALTLITVAFVRLTGIGAVHNPDAAATTVRELRFEDKADGSIDVLDAQAGKVIQNVAPGTNGFLRGTLRGLARERKRQSIGPQPPFLLIGRADGRLTLEDPATGRRVDLESFGPANSSVFAQILAAPLAP